MSKTRPWITVTDAPKFATCTRPSTDLVVLIVLLLAIAATACAGAMSPGVTEQSICLPDDPDCGATDPGLTQLISTTETYADEVVLAQPVAPTSREPTGCHGEGPNWVCVVNVNFGNWRLQARCNLIGCQTWICTTGQWGETCVLAPRPS